MPNRLKVALSVGFEQVIDPALRGVIEGRWRGWLAVVKRQIVAGFVINGREDSFQIKRYVLVGRS